MHFVNISLRNCISLYVLCLLANYSRTIYTDLEPDKFIEALLRHKQYNYVIFFLDSPRTTSSEEFHEELEFVELSTRIIMASSVNTSIFIETSPRFSFYMNYANLTYSDSKLCSYLSEVWNITHGDENYFKSNISVRIEIIQNLIHGSNKNSNKIIVLSQRGYINGNEMESLAMDLRKKGVIVYRLKLPDKYSYSSTYGVSTSGVHNINGVNKKLKQVICHLRQCSDAQHPFCSLCLFTIHNSQALQKRSFCQSVETHSKSERSAKICQDSVCLNGGTCIQGLQKSVCKCPTNFSGTKCENKIKTVGCVSNPCKNGGDCFDREKGFKCCCPKGYAGKFCERKEVPCDSTKCFNGGNCTNDPKGPLCHCLKGFRGERCEINLELKVDVQAEFSGFTSEYIRLHNKRHLAAVTVAFWMKSNYKARNYRGTPFSYSYQNPYTKVIQDNALTLFDTNKFYLYLHQDRIITDIVGNSDNAWHHFAITWRSKTGDWAIYWDGEMKARGTNVATGSRLWSGYFVIGQEQDSLGGAFSQGEAYIGSISQFNVWDHAVSEKNIHLIMQSCGLSGNVFSWGCITAMKVGQLSGIMKSTDLCSGVGMCSEKDCYCNIAKLLRTQKCWRSLDLSTCNPNPCENQQQCIMEGGHPQCRCKEGFEGILCEYDIDECLQNNGNCSEKCINKNGSYECSCEAGKRLASDKHTCVEISYCYYKAGEDTYIYTNGETWKGHCKECHCDRGEVVCNPNQCPMAKCQSSEKEVLSPDKCCLSCVADYSYCNHSGIIYMNNDVWSSNCSNCSCKNGAVSCSAMVSCPVLSCNQDETEILLPWDCCNQCLKKKPSCRFSFENEIRTFDGLKYSLSGSCRYILFTDCKSEDIIIQYESSPSNLIEKALIIYHKCIMVTINSVGRVFVEDEEVELPYIDKGFMSIQSSSYKDNVQLHIYVVDGSRIIWNLPWEIEIWSPSKYKHQLCGLCGNYNGKYDDDHIESSKIATVIADSSYEPLHLCQKRLKLPIVEEYSTTKPLDPTSQSIETSTPNVLLICSLFLWQHSASI